MWFIAFSVFIIIIFGGFFLLGSKKSRSFHDIMQRHPYILKGFVLGYIIFAGCFLFPIESKQFKLDFWKAYLLIMSYIMIGLMCAEVYAKGRWTLVYGLSILLTASGMLCRYLLEYGEVSNTYNFTVKNVMAYLGIIPVGVTLVYIQGSKYFRK